MQGTAHYWATPHENKRLTLLEAVMNQTIRLLLLRHGRQAAVRRRATSSQHHGIEHSLEQH